VRVEPSILVHDHDAGQFAGGVRRADEVAAHLAVSLWRGVFDELALDAFILALHLDLRLGVIRAQRLEQTHGGRAGGRILAGAFQEPAPVDQPMDVAVEQLENFRMEVVYRCACHVTCS
jgi:hypothetical protein